MNPAKCADHDYIHFLIAAQCAFSCTEAARCHPAGSHDAFTRLLTRQPPDTEALWRETQGLVTLQGGVLAVDDSTLDKPYAKRIELVTRHWSGKHHRVVLGINLISMVWSDGLACIPCDFRVYDKPIGGHNKNEHFRAMLASAQARGFQPECVVFDSWYASLDNLKRIRAYDWSWLTRLKANRQVNPDGSGNGAIGSVAIEPEGRRVHLKGYGFIQVFRTVSANGDAQYWATNDLEMAVSQFEAWSKRAWSIETYHRGLKQCCGVEQAQVRSARAQMNHIALSMRAFVRLEVHRLQTGVSWYEAKRNIIREAVRLYLQRPLHRINSTA